MHGFGFSALLVGMLGRHRVPGLDEDLARRDAALRRLGLLAGVNLVLFVALTLAVR
ncbi:hypothetical protein [Roseicella aerolata]|uniref:Uncharacterized protein n=1 Tax=Roseicella aerolata TaxID=2883479 RepID=A0A9X1IEB6_9PROT|nr:hypothetical protein [Roseicella aerolata]MCB4822661.1 hypothetical protein [Roseicella aerolata]